MALVNIIVPFYNSETTLWETLASVENQTYKDWYVIFINDGATDSSASIAQDFLNRNDGKGKIITSLKARSGPAKGRNLALQNCTGQYIVCLDSDDQLLPFCLEQRVAIMEKNTGLDWAVFNQFAVSAGEKNPSKLFNLPVKTRQQAIEKFLKLETCWQTMGPIWKTKAMLSLGGFNDTLFPSEDPDIHLRALLTPDLQMEIYTALPADCYYFINLRGDDKMPAFYSDSIKSKFRFIKSTVEYLPAIVSTSALKIYKKYIRIGYFNFIEGFLLSRLKEHIQQFTETNLLLKNKGILSSKDILLVKFILAVFTSDSLIIKKFRIRGIVKFFLWGIYKSNNAT